MAVHTWSGKVGSTSGFSPVQSVGMEPVLGRPLHTLYLYLWFGYDLPSWAGRGKDGHWRSDHSGGIHQTTKCEDHRLSGWPPHRVGRPSRQHTCSKHRPTDIYLLYYITYLLSYVLLCGWHATWPNSATYMTCRQQRHGRFSRTPATLSANFYLSLWPVWLAWHCARSPPSWRATSKS